MGRTDTGYDDVRSVEEPMKSREQFIEEQEEYLKAYDEVKHELLRTTRSSRLNVAQREVHRACEERRSTWRSPS
jgi:hypothetical protein